MKKRYIVVFISCLILSSCGCGPTFLYNWRPKPWVHPYVANTYTGLDTLLNINGYYISQIIEKPNFNEHSTANGEHDTIVHILEKKYNSIMFYDNGLCTSLSTRVFISEDKRMSTLDTLYSNHIFTNKYSNIFYKKDGTSWGTYEIHNDSLKVYLIEDLIGCDGIRKNIISKIYLITNDKQLKLTCISNSNKEYGYEKILDISNSIFYPLENKRNSMECPYLKKKWFYKKDKIK